MAAAASTLVGQNLGAQQPDRAEKYVWRSAFFNMIFLLTVGILFFTLAPAFLPWFSDDPDVIHHGVLALRIICIGYGFYAYGMVITQAFNGAGDTVTPTWINFLAFWLLQIPLCYSLAVIFQRGPSGVYWGMAISESILAILAIFIFRKGNWKKVMI